MVGESLVGEGNEIAHIDLMLGPRGSAVEEAFTNALANNKMGFTTLLALLEPNLQCRPNTIIFNKVTIKDTHQAVQMFGPAQFAVARAIQDSVADGIIPRHLAEDIYVCVGVFIHWDAKDDAKIQEFNYQATREALWRAVKGAPTAREATEYRDQVTHPFSAPAPIATGQPPATAAEPVRVEQPPVAATQPVAKAPAPHDALRPSIAATMPPHAVLKPDVEHTIAHTPPAAGERWTAQGSEEKPLRSALVPSVTATLASGAATRIDATPSATESDYEQRAAALAADIARAEAVREKARLLEVQALEQAERGRVAEVERAAAAAAAREDAVRAEERRRAELQAAQAAERERIAAAEAERLERHRRADRAEAEARAEQQRRSELAAEAEARAIATARAEEMRAREDVARRSMIASEAEAQAIATRRSAPNYADAVLESRGFAGSPAMPPAMPSPSVAPLQPIEVVQGLLVHKIPTEMKTETTEHVEVRVGGKDVEGLLKDLAGRGELKQYNLPIVETMTVTLDGPAGAFDIVPRSQVTQFVRPNTSILEAFGANPFASWEWDVTPRTAGSQQLRVRVSATVHDSRNAATSIALPDRVFPIDVRVDYGRSAGRFLTRALLWAALTIGAALLGIYTQEIWWPELQEVLGLRP